MTRVVLLPLMLRTDFRFHLPSDLIAQRPAADRSASRLLVLDGATGALSDRQFRDLPSLLEPGDLLVLNDTRVLPARVHGVKDSGGRVEILLERTLDLHTALVQARSSKGLKEGVRIRLPGGASARMQGRDGDLFRLEFSCEVIGYFETHGEMPLPPYVDRAPERLDRERYQTVYARHAGAVAAPTAGLHFDLALFEALAARGVGHAFVTLHVGAGTFQPMRADRLEEHVMHAERVHVSAPACQAVNGTRSAGGRVIAVGTTVVRALETAAAARLARGGETHMQLEPYVGDTRLFITPGYRFHMIDALVTNFHLPESTLIMLCAAWVGREPLLAAYAHAVQERYRFYSYGDAMLMWPTPAARPSA